VCLACRFEARKALFRASFAVVNGGDAVLACARPQREEVFTASKHGGDPA
jgi:hypothetical protein